MLAWCREYMRALCQISVAELRQVAPSILSFLMIISLLLADNLHLVFASKYRQEASSHVNSNLGQKTIVDDKKYGILYSKSGSSDNIKTIFHNQAKVRTKPFMSKRGEPIMNGETKVGNSKLMKSHLHLQLTNNEADTSKDEERGTRMGRNDQASIRENEINDYRKFSSKQDTISTNVGLQSSFSSSSDSSVKSSASLTQSVSSLSLMSAQSYTLNSSNSIGFSVYSSKEDSSTVHTISDTCPGIQQVILSPNGCSSLMFGDELLTLDKNISYVVCNCPSKDINRILKRVRLPFCSSYNAASVFCASSFVGDTDCPHNKSHCEFSLNEIINNIESIEEKYERFNELIGRYDCSTNYSVKWKCHHCQQAYKDWLCSKELHIFRSGKIVPPCMEFCSNVEEMCPFFRPVLKSYAGDHSFICKDPHMNLPSSTPEEGCYGLCDLWQELGLNCSHVNQHHQCSMYNKCSFVSKNETMSNHSNTSNSSTSGVEKLIIISQTSTFFLSFLHIFCLLSAILLRLPLTLTELHYLCKGLT